MPDSDLPAHYRIHTLKGHPPRSWNIAVYTETRLGEQNIAPRLIASTDDQLLAHDDNAPIRALTGWRREVLVPPR